MGESKSSAANEDQARNICAAIEHESQFLNGGRIRLHWEAGAFQIGLNPISLRRILDNLVSNALQASPSETSTVHIRVLQRLTSLTFEVVDCGSGISEKALANLFNDEINDSSEGWGVGLLIVRDLVEEGGGQLYFHSEPGIGTRARVRFPLL